MDILNQILDYIARTNLFNFVIFAIIIALIVKKLDVKSKIKTSVDDVKASIDNSEQTKAESEQKLDSVEKSMERLSDEIDAIILQSEENAALVGKKIHEETDKSLEQIKQNTQNTIENNQVALKNDILKRASMASVEVAKAHIIEELKKNPALHEKLIDESVDRIEGAEI